MRILLHPGFHKTGTSSLQRGAAARSEQLAPHMRMMITQDVLHAARAARRYSARPGDAALRSFAEELTAAIRRLAPRDTRALMISSEDLSGYIPGNHEVPAYDAAPALTNVAVAVLRSHFGDDAQVTVWFTTRNARDWQRSVYWQNLRAMRVTESFEAYRSRLERAARLNDIVAEVARHVGTRAGVTSTPIEVCGTDPLGPLGTALSLLGVPSQGLAPLPAENVQPDGAAEELLALNRSNLDDDTLADAKRRVLQKYRRQGDTTRPVVS